MDHQGLIAITGTKGVDRAVPAAQVSLACCDLLRQLLTPEPDRRITLSRIMRHPWFVRDAPPGLLELNSRLLRRDRSRRATVRRSRQSCLRRDPLRSGHCGLGTLDADRRSRTPLFLVDSASVCCSIAHLVELTATETAGSARTAAHHLGAEHEACHGRALGEPRGLRSPLMVDLPLCRLRWCTQRSREIVGLARHCGADYDPALLKPTPLPKGAEVGGTLPYPGSLLSSRRQDSHSRACRRREWTGQQVTWGV